MLEKPELHDELITGKLELDYGLTMVQLEFLPIGADVNTAAYRAVAADGTPYFIKLRSGEFDELSIAVPYYLETQGISQLIVPIKSTSGRLWTRLERFALILCPFVAGQDGFNRPLDDEQWVALGTALSRVHDADLPDEIRARLPRETFSPRCREEVREYQRYLETQTFSDLVSSNLAALMRSYRDVIDRLVRRAGELAAILRSRPLDFVLCHADLHAGNVLLDRYGRLFVVDWDTLLLAPKERDLMFIGAGIGGVWESEREASLFFRGYGPVEVDPDLIAYYRHERIVEDVAAYCAEILESAPGNKDRAPGLHRLASQFLPNGVIDIAFRTDQSGTMP